MYGTVRLQMNHNLQTQFVMYNLLQHAGKLFPYRENRYLQSIRAYILSGKITALFKHFAVHFIISPPIRLLGGKHISVGDKCVFGYRGIRTAWYQFIEGAFLPSIVIGNHVNIGDYFHINPINRLCTGNGVLTGRWVTISDNAHGTTDRDSLTHVPMKRKLFSKGPVVIGDNVWIGDKASILAGVTIGEGAVIGANAVITQDVSAYYITIGNLTKIIKKVI